MPFLETFANVCVRFFFHFEWNTLAKACRQVQEITSYKTWCMGARFVSENSSLTLVAFVSFSQYEEVLNKDLFL